MFKVKKEKFFTVTQIKELLESVGWESAAQPQKVCLALQKSSHIVSAWDNDKLVGIIRSMDDGIWNANIDCFVVHKNYQNQGIGNRILHELMSDIKNIKYISVSTESKIGRKIFQNIGFIEKNGFYLQFQFKYKKEE